MYNRKVSKSVLMGMGVLIGAVLLVAACGGGTTMTQSSAPVATTKPAEPTAMATTAAMTTTTTMTETMAMTETTAMTETSKQAEMALVMVSDNPTLGKILVDNKGMTLYMFDKDTTDKSNCTGDCLKNWPALTVADEKEVMTPGDGVTGKLAVITRDDGTYQVTVNGMPLYTYAKDSKAGDVVGQAVGDVWWVVSADGMKVDKK
jgi:predicted lipoprotein with Yx(FWY)xxD motif